MKPSLLLSIALSLCATGCAKELQTGAPFSASVEDQDVQAAAEFAIRAQAKIMQESSPSSSPVSLKLVRVTSAQKQVVAGQNFHLTLQVKLDHQSKTAQAVVWWQPWQKATPYQLTSWDWK